MGLVSRLCQALVDKYPERSRTIHRDGQPYLLRFYLTTPRVSEEQKSEDPEQFGIYLHHFYQGDLDEDLHNHPWKWALSFILSGSYIEERMSSAFISYHTHSAGWFNFISHDTFHRVTLGGPSQEPVWTLFTVGPRITSWGFKSPKTGKYWNWKEYLGMKGEKV